MQFQTGNLAWREIGCLTLAGLLLALSAVYMPLLQPLTILLFPLPVALLVRRHHLATALFSLLAVTITTFLLAGNLWAVLSFVVKAGITGVVIGLLFKNYVSPGLSAKILITLSVIMVPGLLLLANGVNDTNLFSLEEDLVAEIKQANRWYLDAGVLSAEEKQQVEKYIEDFIHLMIVLVPGSMVIWAIIQSLVSYVLAHGMFRRLGYDVKNLPPFSSWQYPWYVIWGLIAGLLLFLAGDEWNLILLGNIGKNIIYVTLVLFLVSGISVFTYFTKKWKVHGIVKGLVIFMISIYWPLGLGLVLILGLLDPVVNLRQIDVESGQGG